MKKILLVIRREYSTRVRKKSFWILTILLPILIAIVYATPVYLAQKPITTATVLVVDETEIFTHAFQSNKEVAYKRAGSLDYAKRQLEMDSANLIVFIPSRETTIPNDAFLYYRTDVPGSNVQSDIKQQLNTILHNVILEDVLNISPDDYESLTHTTIALHPKDIETGRDGFLEVKMILGIILAVIIYVAIFMFGGQVMQGVSEEKHSRIVEVMLCSLKPFQLMMGKVVGIGLVGLTQFALWVALSGAGLFAIKAANPTLFEQAEQRQNVTQIATKGTDMTTQLETAKMANDAIPNSQAFVLTQGLVAINFKLIIPLFLIYFLFGYLLYASLFAACGSLVDQGSDGQQFTLPVTIPLLLSLMLIPAMINEPGGTVATWLSIIPFTSPIAMMFRLPFGVSILEVAVSIALLILTFILCTWMAANIYKRGVLLFGKQISYRDIFRWFKRG
ncbi:MAG: ABC transporter permease [Bacteroidales bacterium]|nr:ABC transporter permease [Bacteroidales bacterium]